MKVVLMTGNHPRHLFVAQAVKQTGLLGGLILERRELMEPQPPPGLSPATERLFLRHFAARAASEAKFFRSPTPDGIPTLELSRENLNGEEARDFLLGSNPDLLLVYGVHLLSPDLLACTSGLQWNIHGGLSPWYRGSTTHFWPSYMLEPQMTGMTVHEITQAVDGGRIIHQLAAPLVAGDGLHDLACRTLAAFCEELPDLIKRTADERLHDPQPQRTTGRIWRERDWRPDHLHLIYDFYGDRIVDRYLDGEFSQNPPKLIRQF